MLHDATRAGTDADLRRLGHKRAGELLMTKFGMDADTVAGLARWDRIDAIRRWGLWAPPALHVRDHSPMMIVHNSSA